MSRRNRSWDDELAKRLRGNSEFAREYLLGLIEEGLELKQALREFISAYGVKEYAIKVKMASPNLLRSLRAGASITDATYTKLLKPLGLHLSVAPREAA